MRIDRLEIENFKKYARQAFDFHPKFTLLVGDNGAGKTTVLDALSVAMAVWLVHPPDHKLLTSRRKILRSEIRLGGRVEGDRIQFRDMPPASVKATGSIAGQEGKQWIRINSGNDYDNNSDAKEVLGMIESAYSRDRVGEKLLFPVLAYYGAGRAWLPSNRRSKGKVRFTGPARRWGAFYDCFNERIRTAELQDWFLGETLASVNRRGLMRPGFETVKRAVLNCVPEANNLWYDTDLKQVVLSIGGGAQPFDNLSAGQRMMLALVADLAIKAVTQNAFLLPPEELGQEDQPLPRVLKETPGVVLIDELDVHLHPKWQRRVATDLKNTFPGIQFICTSHSPQVIGEVMPEEVRFLDHDQVVTPSRTFGIDSDRVLDELMDGASSRNQGVRDKLSELAEAINQEDFPRSEQLLREVEEILGENDPEVTHYRTLISFLRATP